MDEEAEASVMTQSSSTLPLVSVVVPVFNGERYLRESLDSIVGQTFGSMEVLVMDDASSDGTAQIVAAYGDRVRYYRQPANRGIYGNANDGIAKARGRYIAVYHADDVYDPRIVEREVAFLECYPDAGAVFSQYIFIDPMGREFGRLQIPAEVRGAKPLEYRVVFNALLKYKNRFLACPSCMVRASVHRDVGGYRDDEFRNSSDLDMWLRIARRYPIGILEEYLLRYRQGHGSSAQRYHHLRAEPERFFRIMDGHLEDGARAVAGPDALHAYEAHRAEDWIMCAMSAYILGRRTDAGAALAQVRPTRILGSNQVRRMRLLALCAGLHLLVRIPRISMVANLLQRRRMTQRFKLAAATGGAVDRHR